MNSSIKLLLLTLFICYVIGGVSACGEKDHPKDEQLIQNFQNNKEEFNQLVQMFLEDKSLGRVASDFTRTSNFFEKCEEPNSWSGKEIEVTAERLAKYRKIFNNLGLSAGIEGYCEKNRVFLHASTKGLSVTGSTKGYAYLKKAPENPDKLVDNLDNYWSPDGKSFRAFRHIEGNWYLYFDYED